MSDEITKIRVGDFYAGMIGLKEIFEKMQSSSLKKADKIIDKLIQLGREKNYIPDAALDKYKNALWREYRRFLGETVEEIQSNELTIRVLGPGCLSCEQMMKDIVTILAELGIAADLEHVRDADAIASYGILATPALIINNKIMSSGRKPGLNRIFEWIHNEIKKNG